MAENLKILGDKSRLTILTLLKERELCVCDIVDLLSISQPNASQHLRKMKAAGLVNESIEWAALHMARLANGNGTLMFTLGGD